MTLTQKSIDFPEWEAYKAKHGLKLPQVDIHAHEGDDELKARIANLDTMVTDKEEITRVWQYTENCINLSRKVSAAVPHKGTTAAVEAAFESMVLFWKDYETGPRQVAVDALDGFLVKYESDEGYERAYRGVFDDLIKYVEEQSDPSKVPLQKQLTTAYKYHHKSKAASLQRLLDVNEQEIYRRNCVDNAVKRIVTSMQAKHKARQPVDAALMEQARAALDLLPAICAKSSSLDELHALVTKGHDLSNQQK